MRTSYNQPKYEAALDRVTPVQQQKIAALTKDGNLRQTKVVEQRNGRGSVAVMLQGRAWLAAKQAYASRIMMVYPDGSTDQVTGTDRISVRQSF
jgi:hypothetical protein